jgi:DNA polymerase mu
MPHTRPSLHSIPVSSSSSIQIHHVPIHQLYPLFANLTFHIIPAKIGETIGRVYECVEELGGRCVSVEEARFVITELRGRPRLVRAVGREWIVSLQRQGWEQI